MLQLKHDVMNSFSHKKQSIGVLYLLLLLIEKQFLFAVNPIDPKTNTIQVSK